MSSCVKLCKNFISGFFRFYFAVKPERSPKKTENRSRRRERLFIKIYCCTFALYAWTAAVDLNIAGRVLRSS